MQKTWRIACGVVPVLSALWFTTPALAAPEHVAGLTALASKAAPSFEQAVRYEHGEGVAQSYERAHQLYCDAADAGDSRAYLNLGWMFLNGRGVARDSAVAVVWFRKAADSGVAQAGNLLATLASTAPATKNGCPERTIATPPPPLQPVIAPAAIRDMVQKIAPAAGLESNLVMAVIAAESAFDVNAVSRKNAMGLMQLLPETAVRFGVKDPFDPAENIRGGTTYLRWLLRRFDGNVTLALAAYNAGETTVDNYGGVPPYDETIQYIERIKRHYRLDDPPHK